MNKLEYLKTLETALQTRMGQQEVNEVIRDYAEYFAEGARQGKSDEEIAANLGDPIEVARQVIAESQEVNRQTGTSVPKTDKSIVTKILLVVLGLCLLPFVVGVAICLLSGAAAAIVCLFGAVALCGCGVLFGLAALVISLMYIGVLPVTAIVLCCLGGVGLAALGVLGLCLSLLIIRAIWHILCWCGRKLYAAVTKKPYPAKAQPAPQSVPAQGWQPAEPAPQPEEQLWQTAEPAEPVMQPEFEEELSLEPTQAEEEEAEQDD